MTVWYGMMDSQSVSVGGERIAQAEFQKMCFNLGGILTFVLSILDSASMGGIFSYDDIPTLQINHPIPYSTRYVSEIVLLMIFLTKSYVSFPHYGKAKTWCRSRACSSRVMNPCAEYSAQKSQKIDFIVIFQNYYYRNNYDNNGLWFQEILETISTNTIKLNNRFVKHRSCINTVTVSNTD